MTQVLSWNLTCSASLPTLVIWQTEFSIPSNKWVSCNYYAAWDSWITLAYEHKKQYWNLWWAASKYNLWLVVIDAKTKQKKRSITDKLLFLLSLQPLVGRFCKWNMKERFFSLSFECGNYYYAISGDKWKYYSIKTISHIATKHYATK